MCVALQTNKTERMSLLQMTCNKLSMLDAWQHCLLPQRRSFQLHLPMASALARPKGPPRVIMPRAPPNQEQGVGGKRTVTPPPPPPAKKAPSAQKPSADAPQAAEPKAPSATPATATGATAAAGTKAAAQGQKSDEGMIPPKVISDANLMLAALADEKHRNSSVRRILEDIISPALTFLTSLANEDAGPLGFGGFNEFSTEAFHRFISENGQYSCTVPLHWLGVSRFAHQGIWPSFGAVKRVHDQLLTIDGQLSINNLAQLRVQVRRTSDMEPPARGEYEFIDGDANRLAFLMGLVESMSEVNGSDVAAAFAKAARPDTPLQFMA